MFFEAEFYTSGHVIRGHIDSAYERLSDLLNLKNETALIVRDARIERLLNLGKAPPLQVPDLRLEKHLIMLACPIQHDMSIKSVYRRASRMMYRMIVLLPSFEVVGVVHITEKFDTRKVLLSRTEDFIPLTDAVATCPLFPGVRIQHSPIIFNKHHMVMLGELPQAEASVEKPKGMDFP